MSVHHFTLIVDGPDIQSGAVIDALYEAGCDDALIGRTDGIQYVEFDREAKGLVEAVLSAVADIERVDGVKVVRIAGEPEPPIGRESALPDPHPGAPRCRRPTRLSTSPPTPAGRSSRRG